MFLQDMEKHRISGSEIDRLLRGDISDIEDLEEVDEEVDEYAAISEDVLQDKLAEFERLLEECEVDLSQVSDNEFLIDPDGILDPVVEPETTPDCQPAAADPQPPDLEVDQQPLVIDEYENENKPLFDRLTKKEQKAWRKKRDIKRWKKLTNNAAFPQLEADIDMQTPRDHVLLPREYFSMFIDDDIILNLVEQTNLYSMQKRGNSIGVSRSEMEHMISSIVKMPSYRMYWGGRH